MKTLLPLLAFLFFCLPKTLAQEFYLTPLFASKISTNLKTEKIGEWYNYMSTTTHFGKLPIPLLFGLQLEVKQNKHLFGVGFVGGDPVHSWMTMSAYPGRLNKEYMLKVPLKYSYTFWDIPRREAGHKLEIAALTGLNINILEYSQTSPQDLPTEILPHFSGGNVGIMETLDGLHNPVSLSLTAGLSFTWNAKGWRALTLSAYYEQGLMKLAQTTVRVYQNGQVVEYASAASRGSGFYFKVEVPIRVFRMKSSGLEP